MTTGEQAVSSVRLSPYTDATHARIALARAAAELSDLASTLVPIGETELHANGEGHFAGDQLQTALTVVSQAQQVLVSSVVAKRMAGMSWEQIGEALNTRRQAAHARFTAAATRFADQLLLPADGIDSGESEHCSPHAPRGPSAAAAALDAWVVERRAPSDVDDAPNPVSRGLIRMDAKAELAALSRREHALFAEHAMPPLDQLLAIAERELALWEQTLATGTIAPDSLAHRAAAKARHRIEVLRAGLHHMPADATRLP
jgi:hypothetical protein